MDEELYDLNSLIVSRIPTVRDVIDELVIYNHYAPDLKLNGANRDPFLPADTPERSPSFSLYEKNGRISFKDHSSGKHGDIYTFVELWYERFKGVKLEMRDLNRVMYYDLKLSNTGAVNNLLFFEDDESGPRQFKGHKTERFGLQVKDIGWTSWAQDYWTNKYGICPSILKAYYCGHAKEVWATPPGKKTYLWGVSTPESPIFYFYFPKTGHMKCYRPKEKGKKKWIMNCDNNTDVQGYYQMKIQLTKPKLVIFTKAMKEVMFYRSFHIDALAIHGENHHFTDDFIRHVRKYSDHQLAVYDNDYPGRKAAVRFRERHGVEQFLIQGAKNITDLWEKDPDKVRYYIDLLKITYDI